MSPRIMTRRTIVITTIVGGTGSVAPATVAWGPDFGEGAGSDGKTFSVGVAAPTMPAVALASSQRVGGQVTMPSLAVASSALHTGVSIQGTLAPTYPDVRVGTHAAQTDVSIASSQRIGSQVTMPAIEMASSQRVGMAPRLTDLALQSSALRVGTRISGELAIVEPTLNVGTRATLPAVSMASLQRVGTVPRMTDMALSGGRLNTGVDISQLQWVTGDIKSAQAVWWDELAVCVGTTNHPNDDLRIDGVAATRKNAIAKWDLSGFPTNATVTAAQLKIQKVAAGGLVNRTLHLRRVSTANVANGEGWQEADVDCNANPDSNQNSTQSVTITPATGAVTVTLNSLWRTAIQDRMGRGNLSAYFLDNALDTEFRIEGNDASTLRPRINFTYTTPT